MRNLDFKKSLHTLLTTQFPDLKSIWAHKLSDHSPSPPVGPLIFGATCARLWVPPSEWEPKPEFRASQLSYQEYKVGQGFYRLFGQVTSCFPVVRTKIRS